MPDTDFCLEVTGKSFGYLSADPVLSEGGLNENIHCRDKEEQGKKEPLQYFFKSLQAQQFKV